MRLVYEDQGEPFVIEARDCVSQSPHIRHRVLEASDGLEIEIASPAAHEPRLEHDMLLPTGPCLPERIYSGQTFLLHRAKEADWESGVHTSLEEVDTGMMRATDRLAEVHALRPAEANSRYLELL